MKRLIYEIATEVNLGTEDNPKIEQVLSTKKMQWNEANEEIAKCEAYNGQYTIEDDGQPEPEALPSAEERIAELEEALALLLSGVTE